MDPRIRGDDGCAVVQRRVGARITEPLALPPVSETTTNYPDRWKLRTHQQMPDPSRREPTPTRPIPTPPEQTINPDNEADEASYESFPASDAPAWTGSQAGPSVPAAENDEKEEQERG
jgi:hypothetical protein